MSWTPNRDEALALLEGGRETAVGTDNGEGHGAHLQAGSRPRMLGRRDVYFKRHATLRTGSAASGTAGTLSC